MTAPTSTPTPATTRPKAVRMVEPRGLLAVATARRSLATALRTHEHKPHFRHSHDACVAEAAAWEHSAAEYERDARDRLARGVSVYVGGRRVLRDASPHGEPVLTWWGCLLCGAPVPDTPTATCAEAACRARLPLAATYTDTEVQTDAHPAR